MRDENVTVEYECTECDHPCRAAVEFTDEDDVGEPQYCLYDQEEFEWKRVGAEKNGLTALEKRIAELKADADAYPPL
jgi:hypothetical protein